MNLFYSFLLSNLSHYPPDRVINMDETPLPFVPSVWNVISKKGDPTVLNTGKHKTYTYTNTEDMYWQVVFMRICAIHVCY